MVKRICGHLGLFALLIGLSLAGTLGHRVGAQESTPEATPAADEVEPAATEQPEIVTLIAWYQADEENDLLVLVPLETSPAGVASPGEPTDALTGTVDFEAERNAGGLPRITLGGSIFDAYPIVEGDRNSVQQWFFFQGNDTGRPATLVMQVTADAGPYEGAIGTATFMSRALDSTGVVVIVLYLNA
jgi:hypothetical protein